MGALDKVVEKGFLRIGSIVPSEICFGAKRSACGSKGFLKTLAGKYTVKRTLSLLGISRASYYAALKNEYCPAAMERISQNKQDADLIRQVMEYKGFAKWSRQIYMMLPTRDHEYAAPLNAVKQDFYIGPRKVILTDVTYLYYGPARTPVYL